MREKIWAVVPAAGTGTRMREGLENQDLDIREKIVKVAKKQFIELNGKELLVYCLETLQKTEEIEGVILVTGREDINHCHNLCHDYHLTKVRQILEGGTRRQNSVFIGLSALPKDCSMVVIHDGARPFVTVEEIRATINAARRCGGAVLGVPVKDTIKVVDHGRIVDTPERSTLYQAQTPQTFAYPQILEGYRHAVVMGDFRCTDDSQVMEKYMDTHIEMVPGSYENIKITTPADLRLAEQILAGHEKEQRG